MAATMFMQVLAKPFHIKKLQTFMAGEAQTAGIVDMVQVGLSDNNITSINLKYKTTFMANTKAKTVEKTNSVSNFICSVSDQKKQTERFLIT